VIPLWWCPFVHLYKRRPCEPLLSTHADAYVGDVLAEADLDWRELDAGLWAERWARGERPPAEMPPLLRS